MSRSQFDPANYAAQLAEKQQRLIELLAPFDAPAPEVFESPREHYRLRAEFRLWREGEDRHYAMFEAGDKHTPIFFEEFPIASAQINALMPRLKTAWQASSALSFKLFQVEFHGFGRRHGRKVAKSFGLRPTSPRPWLYCLE